MTGTTHNDNADAEVDQFLEFLEKDIQNNPQSICNFDSKLVHRIQRLVGDLDIDIDQPLSNETAMLATEKRHE